MKIKLLTAAAAVALGMSLAANAVTNPMVGGAAMYGSEVTSSRTR